MAFTTFYKESKSYMCYDTMTWKQKLNFWMQYPKAWIKFSYLNWRDGV